MLALLLCELHSGNLAHNFLFLLCWWQIRLFHPSQVLRAMSLLNKSYLTKPIFTSWYITRVQGCQQQLHAYHWKKHGSSVSLPISLTHLCKRRPCSMLRRLAVRLRGVAAAIKTERCHRGEISWDGTFTGTELYLNCYWLGQRARDEDWVTELSCLLGLSMPGCSTEQAGETTCPTLNGTERGRTGVVEPGGM